MRNFFFQKFITIYVIDFPNSGQVFANVKIPVAVTMLIFNPADKNNSTATKVYYYLYDGDYQQTASWLVDNNNKLFYKDQK